MKDILLDYLVLLFFFITRYANGITKVENEILIAICLFMHVVNRILKSMTAGDQVKNS